MAISLGYYIVEGILIRLLSTAFDWFDQVADYLPMRNINALVGNTSGAVSGTNAGNAIGTLHASLVLTAYVVVFAGLAALVFRNRDIGSAGGG